MQIIMVDHTDVDDMAAGIELDTFVAERVMGWTDHKDGLFWSKELGLMRLIPSSVIHESRKKLGITEDRVGDGFLWSPSTDITSAWEVIEKMYNGERRFHWAIYSGHLCEFSPFGPNGSPLYRTPQCESAPLAICRAALKAVIGEDLEPEEKPCQTAK